LLGELQRRLDMAILITARDRDLIAAIADEIYALPSSSTYSDSAASS
jgi:ABC-type microcin C transport system duplicated ATPase subunit YejF